MVHAGPSPQYRVARFSVSSNNPSGAQERGPDVGGGPPPSQPAVRSPHSSALQKLLQRIWAGNARASRY
ncbi:hypothetical protein SRHO_G00291920 [Serrasalmus rhombeus]